MSRAVTLALAMAAPEGSVMTPVMLALTSWPQTNAQADSTNVPNMTLDINQSPIE
jgi:hypothetical protein